jgi:hypothetical protein
MSSPPVVEVCSRPSVVCILESVFSTNALLLMECISTVLYNLIDYIFFGCLIGIISITLLCGLIDF